MANYAVRDDRNALLRPLFDLDRRSRGMSMGMTRWGRVEIVNTANLIRGENVGCKAAAPVAVAAVDDVGGNVSAAPAAPAAGGDDDGGGDGDGDPDRQTQPTKLRINRKAPLPPAALARPRQACALLGIGRTKLHQLSESDPRFPRKIVLGARCVGWRIDALNDYLRTVESGV